MKKILITTAILSGIGVAASAQTLSVPGSASQEIIQLGDPVAVQPLFVNERMPARHFERGSTDQVLEMENFVYNIDAAEGILDASYSDMSGDGQAEALVILNDCDADGSCSWRLYAHRGGNVSIVGGDRGRDVAFSGTDGGGAVVWSDGVTWAYSGYSAYPFGSSLDGLTPTRGTASDVEIMNAQPEFNLRGAPTDIDVYLADFLPGMEGAERFYVARGLQNSYGTSGYPYALADAHGRLLDYGMSLDTPAVFPREGGGLTILTNGAAGISAVQIAATDVEDEATGDTTTPREASLPEDGIMQDEWDDGPLILE